MVERDKMMDLVRQLCLSNNNNDNNNIDNGKDDDIPFSTDSVGFISGREN
jgi:hypothetical protein